MLLTMFLEQRVLRLAHELQLNFGHPEIENQPNSNEKTWPSLHRDVRGNVRI